MGILMLIEPLGVAILWILGLSGAIIVFGLHPEWSKFILRILGVAVVLWFAVIYGWVVLGLFLFFLLAAAVVALLFG